MRPAQKMWFLALRDLGQWVLVPAAMAALMVPCSWIFDGWRAALPFASIAVTLGIGGRLTRRFADHSEDGQNVGAAALGIGLAWLTFVSVCAIPFYSMSAWHSGATAYGTVVDALFESISGLTTCGMTMASDANGLPQTLQLWRSLLQWVGGVGVIVLALTMLGESADPEGMVGTEVGTGNLADDAQETAKRIWKCYAGISGLIFVGYLATGVHWWEALNHAMSTASTGGFSVTSNSFADYGWGPRTVACVGMILSAVSFGFYDDLFRRRFARAASSKQTWTLVIVLVVGMGVMGLYSEQSWGQLLFQWCSAVTTCGFTTTGALESWQPIVLIILAAAMAMGGCAGSTTGGFKTLRLVRVLAALRMRLWSSAGRGTSAGDQLIDEDVDLGDDEREVLVRTMKAGNFIFLYLLSWLLTMLALSLAMSEEYDVGQLLFESASALSAVGLTAGMVSGDMPTAAKIVIEVAMWVGRLEVVGGLAMFFGLFHSIEVAVRNRAGEEDESESS